MDNYFNPIINFVKRKHKIFIGIGAFLFLIFGLYIFVQFFLSSIIKNKIIQSVNQSSKGLYSLHIENFKLKFWSGGIYMEGIKISQDTALLNQWRKESPKANLSNIDINVGEVEITTIGWENYLFNNSLKVGKVFINEPQFYFNGNVPQDTLVVSNRSFLEQLPGLVASFAGSLKIEELEINQGELDFNLSSSSGTSRQKAKQIFLDMKDIEIDTSSVHKALYTTKVHFRLQDYQLITSDSLYKLNVGKIIGSYADSLLNIEDISLITLDNKGNQDKYETFIPRIQNRGIDFSLFFKEKKVSLTEMAIESPRINFIYHQSSSGKQGDSSQAGASGNFLKTILPYISYSFNMGRFAINNGSFKTNIITSSGEVLQQGNNLFVKLDSINIDTATLKNGNYWDNLRIRLSDYKANLTAQNLRINVHELSALSVNQSLDLRGVEISRLYFSHSDSNAYKNHTKEVNIKGVDYHRLLFGEGIAMHSVNINGMELDITNYEAKLQNSQMGFMPNELMKQVPVYIRINNIYLENANIKYFNYAVGAKNPGVVTFEKTDFHISNITNDKKLMSSKHPAILTGQTYVMGEGLLKLKVKIPLLSDNFSCSYSGSLGKMKATYFNSLLEQNGLELASGTIEAQHFDVIVLNGKATGEMILLYHNLNAKLVNKKTGKVKHLLSHIANFILKNSNKKNVDEGPKTAVINYNRKKDDGFLSFIWNSISDGIIKTVVKDFFEPFVKSK